MWRSDSSLPRLAVRARLSTHFGGAAQSTGPRRVSVTRDLPREAGDALESARKVRKDMSLYATWSDYAALRARVRAAFVAVRLRPVAPLVRTAFFADVFRAALPRR